MNDCIKQLEATGDYRIIKRFTPVASYCEPNEGTKRVDVVNRFVTPKLSGFLHFQ